MSVEMKYDILIADAGARPVMVFDTAITAASLKRGLLLGWDTTSNKAIPYAAGGEPLGILADDFTDQTEVTKVPVYVGGAFNKAAVVFDGTLAAADVFAFRKAGIQLVPVAE